MQSNFKVFLVDSSEDPPRVMTALPGTPRDEESALRLAMVVVKHFITQLDLEMEFVSIYMHNREVDIGIGKVPGVWVKVEELPFGAFAQGITLEQDKVGPHYRNTTDFGKEITINGEKIHLMPPITDVEN